MKVIIPIKREQMKSRILKFEKDRGLQRKETAKLLGFSYAGALNQVIGGYSRTIDGITNETLSRLANALECEKTDIAHAEEYEYEINTELLRSMADEYVQDGRATFADIEDDLSFQITTRHKQCSRYADAATLSRIMAYFGITEGEVTL